MSYRRIVLSAAVAAAMAVCGLATAEESQVTGAGSTAAVDLNFQVNINGVLRFRVGSSGTTVDTIEFTPTANELENNATSVAGTGGDPGPGRVTVEIFTNRGDVQITESNDGGGSGLDDGSGNTISYSRIATVSENGNISPPQLSDTGGTQVTVGPTSSNGNITRLDDIWEYTFDASNLDAAPGTYTGQVTYTAATP